MLLYRLKRDLEVGQENRAGKMSSKRRRKAVTGWGCLVVALITGARAQTPGNVIAALEAARNQGLVTVAFTGKGGGRMANLADHLLAIESKETARIQEAHILAGHMICDWIELDCLCGVD